MRRVHGIARLALVHLAIPASAALGGTPAGAPSDSLRPRIEFRDLGRGLLFARGSLDLPCAPRRVFDVVTDYDRLPSFLSMVDSSVVLRRDSSSVIVRQVGTARFPLFDHRVHMTLRFREQPPEWLRFEITSGDFPVYYGTWHFETQGTGARLVYSVTFKPPAFVPQALVRHYMQRDLRTMLRETAAEIGRRATAAPPAATPPPGSQH